MNNINICETLIPFKSFAGRKNVFIAFCFKTVKSSSSFPVYRKEKGGEEGGEKKKRRGRDGREGKEEKGGKGGGEEERR